LVFVAIIRGREGEGMGEGRRGEEIGQQERKGYEGQGTVEKGIKGREERKGKGRGKEKDTRGKRKGASRKGCHVRGNKGRNSSSCDMLWGEKPPNGPLGNLNTGACSTASGKIPSG